MLSQRDIGRFRGDFMEMLTVYTKENAYPRVIFDKGDGIFYDDRLYTEVKPPEGIYLPCEFIDGQWIGTPKEEFEENAKTNQEDLNNEQIENNEKDKVIADLVLKQLELEVELEKERENNATLLLNLVEKGVLSNVQDD